MFSFHAPTLTRIQTFFFEIRHLNWEVVGET